MAFGALQELPDPDLLRALEQFLRFVVGIFGPNGTILLFVALYIMAFGWRWYSHRREDRELNNLKSAYEGRIESLEARVSQLMSVLLNRGIGMDDAEVREILNSGQPSSLPKPSEEPGLQLTADEINFIRRYRKQKAEDEEKARRRRSHKD